MKPDDKIYRLRDSLPQYDLFSPAAINDSEHYPLFRCGHPAITSPVRLSFSPVEYLKVLDVVLDEAFARASINPFPEIRNKTRQRIHCRLQLERIASGQPVFILLMILLLGQ